MAYREVGVAVVPAHGMKIIFVVFGSRPGVLPALYDPSGGVVYLSSERYKWAAGGSWIQDVKQVSITQGDAGAAWTPYALTVPAPADPNAAFHVGFNDGSATLDVKLNPRADIAWLPANVHLNPAVAGTGDQPPPTAPIAAGPPNLIVTYNENSLDITVVGDQPQSIVGLDIAGGGQMIASPMWNNPNILLDPMFAIPPGHCLQAWRYDVAVNNTVPAECTKRVEVIYIMQPSMFWMTADFEVRYKGIVLKTCTAAAGRCEVHIP
jgi:hypothetical protein